LALGRVLKEEEVAGVNDAPAGVAGLEVPSVDLTDGASAVVGGGEGLGLPLEGDPRGLVGEAEDPAIVLGGQFGATRNQLLLPQQADRAVARQRDRLVATGP